MRVLLRIAAITTAAGLLLAPAADMASASASHPAATHAARVHLRGGTTSLTTVPGLAGALRGGHRAVRDRAWQAVAARLDK